MHVSSEPELFVVLPAYNEEACIQRVVTEWVKMLRQNNIHFRLLVIDDGSTDGTAELIGDLAESYEEVECIHTPNRGHGAAVLEGYRRAEGLWVLQADGDGEVGAAAFESVWAEREQADFVLARRLAPESSRLRRLVRRIESAFCFCLFGKRIDDINCPLRLMRADTLPPLLEKLPHACFAPNALLSVLYVHRGACIRQVDVFQAGRLAGHSSLKGMNLLSGCLKAFFQLLRLRFRLWYDSANEKVAVV